ncbi:MAG: response regulator [Lachnospiraceae bacterium]|nr:response regulator [Lachnospiraceae bacterium]
MSQYSVLLVDDEEEVFEVIRKKLDWESIGFRVVGYARNGVEALEMAEELQPDVVMSDIKMPYMDGLTLCRKLKELYPTMKVIIFSGFDDFEYAKEAIKIEAEEYILKPINANELREVYERIKINLDRELDEKRNIDKLREYYMESLPVLQENFYTSLIEGRITGDAIEEYARNYQVELTGPYYVVTVLHISKTNPATEDVIADPILLAMSVEKLAKEQLTGKWNSKVVTYLGDIIVITQLSSEDSITQFTDKMDRICQMAKRVCKARVTAGIGHICNQPAQLPMSYQGAQNAISYRVLYGTTRAINIAETDPRENADIPWEEPYIREIIKKIKMGEAESLQEAIKEFISKLSVSKMSLQKYRILIMELITEIFRFSANNQINLDVILGENSTDENNDIYTMAMQLESSDALGEWLSETCLKLQKQILNERRDTTKSFVTKAIEYVKEHYSDQDLSIETVCSYLNVSAAYFSTVFKKETGKTFINYLTDYRMEEAENLLLMENEKTYIIAQKVGYSDPNYFSYAFKKQFGMSPSKYKTSKLEQTE